MINALWVNPLAALRKWFETVDDEASTYSFKFKRSENIMIHDKRRLLKIKLKSLAEEARIIRQEESKLGQFRHRLRSREYHKHEDELSEVFNVTLETEEKMAAARKTIKQKLKRIQASLPPFVPNPLREEMHQHRVRDLRLESRATLLAYQYLRGKRYPDCEPVAQWSKTGYHSSGYHQDVLWKKVEAMVAKYGSWKGTENLKSWREAV